PSAVRSLFLHAKHSSRMEVQSRYWMSTPATLDTRFGCSRSREAEVSGFGLPRLRRSTSLAPGRTLRAGGAKMTTVVFVHGTGVRQARYATLFATMSARLTALRPDVGVGPCLWGDRLGTTLPEKPASIPDYVSTGGGVREPNDPIRRSQERWVLLDIDPLHELRCLAVIFERERE